MVVVMVVFVVYYFFSFVSRRLEPMLDRDVKDQTTMNHSPQGLAKDNWTISTLNCRIKMGYHLELHIAIIIFVLTI